MSYYTCPAVGVGSGGGPVEPDVPASAAWVGAIGSTGEYLLYSPVSLPSPALPVADLAATCAALGIEYEAASAWRIGPRTIDKRAFLDRFADDEETEINLSRDPGVMRFRNMLYLHPRPDVDLDAPDLIAGLEHFTTVMREDGVTPLLAAHRPDEIRA